MTIEKVKEISDLTFENGRNKELVNLLKFMNSGKEINLPNLLEFVEMESKDIDNNYKLLNTK